MSRTSEFRFGPESTPRTIKVLLIIFVVVNLLASVTTSLTSWSGISTTLGLSLDGINNLFLWQFLSYTLLTDASASLSFSSLIDLLFHSYLFWISSSVLCNYLGRKSYLSYLLWNTLIAGIVVSLCLWAYPYPDVFANSAPLIYSLLFFWLFLNPEMEFLLFFTIPVKAKWLVIILLGVILLVDLGQGLFATLGAHLSTLFFTYLYAVCVCSLSFPFASFRNIDALFFRLSNRFFRNKKERDSDKTVISEHTKIFDFKTGEALLKDDAFVDAMLEKVSKYGEKSLSRKERTRMQKIAKNKCK